jgi:hypothetical protein
MKISKSVFIAAIIISLTFVFLFIVFQTLITQLIIILKDTSTIVITPRLESWDSPNSSNNLVIASQTPNLPGVFSVGMVLHISKTGGDGLRIRSFAGFDGIPIYLGLEGEEFEIIEGPKIIDSEIWWKIVSISNHQKIGWAVQDYLKQQ